MYVVGVEVHRAIGYDGVDHLSRRVPSIQRGEQPTATQQSWCVRVRFRELLDAGMNVGEIGGITQIQLLQRESHHHQMCMGVDETG